jgi:hypothetical protein
MRHQNGEELLFDVSMEKPGAYNPKKDFHEAVNLIDALPEQAETLRQELRTWVQTLPVPNYEKGFHSSLYEFIEKRWGFRSSSKAPKKPEKPRAAVRPIRNTPPALSASTSGAFGGRKPNVIMILIDDMGWADSAPYGSQYYDTPNLTRLCRKWHALHRCLCGGSPVLPHTGEHHVRAASRPHSHDPGGDTQERAGTQGSTAQARRIQRPCTKPEQHAAGGIYLGGGS